MIPALEPVLETDVQDAIATAAGKRQRLRLSGNATRRRMLRSPDPAATSLSLAALTGITLYEPKALVITARAGTPVSTVAAALAEHGQQLIAEPTAAYAFHETNAAPTLGGMVAANVSGPRRIAWGATRDHVLGLRAINGKGELLRVGGRVLKNVTGLDLCKLLTGSHGTLAALTEITLKVRPTPETAGAVLLAGLDPVAAVAALSAALGSPYGVSGAAYLPPTAAARIPDLVGPGQSATVIRIEDSAASVRYRLGRLQDSYPGQQTALLDDSATHALFAALGTAAPLAVPSAGAVWRVSVRPSSGPGVLAGAEAAFGATGFLDWGGGLVWLAGPAIPHAHATVLRAAASAGGTFMLMDAPDGFAAMLDVIPPEPPSLAALSTRIRAAFDPHGIFDAARLYRL